MGGNPAADELKADVERLLSGSVMEEDVENSTSKRPLTATSEGVVKGPTYMVAHSKWKSLPKWSMMRRGPPLMRCSSAPAPGTYDLPDPEKTKYKTGPRFGFGIGSRFGMDMVPSKTAPGPAAYNPKDPSLTVGTKVGFGTSVRSPMGSAPFLIPGPGAYEQKTTMGTGAMFTAKGKQPASYMKRAQSAPGPGAYTPSLRVAYKEPPRCGFGTSTRAAESMKQARANGTPGPGTYEMQNQNGIGREAVKYSAGARRRVHDLNSYITPGPGTYNAHVTSFGY